VAVVRLGVTTDTHDLSGRVLERRPVPPLGRREIEQACRPFVGRILQVPPMYSAVHHEGRRLYELAREGVEVERAPREVLVRSIAVEDATADRMILRVVCGKGTYVRVLAADLGARLGCGAAVERLVRVRVGPFGLAEAVSWEELRGGTAEALAARVRPPEAALAGWPAVRLDAHRAVAFVHGQAVAVAGDVEPAALVRVHDDVGVFLGVGQVTRDRAQVRPVRVLHADLPGSRVLPA
jgi:tRNA pseudouridine55 synthase